MNGSFIFRMVCINGPSKICTQQGTNVHKSMCIFSSSLLGAKFRWPVVAYGKCMDQCRKKEVFFIEALSDINIFFSYYF